MFIHQQDVELTVPIMKESQQILALYPLIQLKFTDLEANGTMRYKFSMPKSPPSFLSIHETSGEVRFSREHWFNQNLVRKQKVVVKNIETGATAKTFLTINIVQIEKTEFCRKHSCFFDNIRFMTAEFNKRRGNDPQIIGDINPAFYRRICDPLETFYLSENGRHDFISEESNRFLSKISLGTNLIETSTKNQILKTSQLNHEIMRVPQVTVALTCERTDDGSAITKPLTITIVDRNDNPVYVDDDSENVKIFRSELEFFEV